ncbi:MAG: COX15/CtaA family protein [Acidobacteria bacterium]|nr:COX15/CtaA family protein [Acidobacteriota bacterium]
MAHWRESESLSALAEGRESGPSRLSSLSYSAALHRLCLLTAAATFVLIIAGALVVGNEAGLAVPDWPLSFGTWMPPMVGGVFYEHGHRIIATAVGFLTSVLAAWLWRAEPRGWVRRLGWITLAAVVFQGILGGITVLYKLPTAVVVGHACLAQFFFCLTLSLAVFTGRNWNQSAALLEDRQSPSFRQLTAATSLALAVQLALGAALRHNALDVVLHLLGASVAAILIGWVVLRAMTQLPEQKPLQRLAMILGILLIVQLALGGVSYFTRLAQNGSTDLDPVMIWTTTGHVAAGALLLGTSWVLTLLSFRRLAAPRVEVSLHQSAQKSPA